CAILSNNLTNQSARLHISAVMRALAHCEVHDAGVSIREAMENGERCCESIHLASGKLDGSAVVRQSEPKPFALSVAREASEVETPPALRLRPHLPSKTGPTLRANGFQIEALPAARARRRTLREPRGAHEASCYSGSSRLTASPKLSHFTEWR